MTAWAFTHAWNEEVILPYWVRHYRTFCDRVIVYLDTTTDDRSEQVAIAEGAEVRPMVSDGLDDVAFVAFAQEHYPEARGQADWVIWTDADEILYHPHLKQRLRDLHDQGVNYPTVTGYSMMADGPPTGAGQIYEEIRAGFRSDAYSKACIFAPELDVHWQTGKHTATVVGGVKADDGSDPLRLLHYRWLGQEYFLERNRRNFARLNPINKAMQHGRELYPGYNGDYSPAWYREQLQQTAEVV